MPYHRVLPRDLFNDANLLKCMGRLIMLIDDLRMENVSYTYHGSLLPTQILN